MRVTHLVAREDQCIRNHNILAPTGGKYNHLSNVIGCKWLAAAVVPIVVSICPCAFSLLRVI